MRFHGRVFSGGRQQRRHIAKACKLDLYNILIMVNSLTDAEQRARTNTEQFFPSTRAGASYRG